MAQESEEALEKSLAEYDAQIVELDLLLLTCEGAPPADIKELYDQLKELRQLTEESLLISKKSRLLQMLDGGDAAQGSAPAVSAAPAVAATAAASSPGGTLTSSTSGDNSASTEPMPGSESDIMGMKCRAPLVQSWGATQYFNAMIYSVDEPNAEGQDRVRVLFTHPTHLPIKPCPHFLEGNCRFDQEKCRFSHGHIVRVQDLEPYHEPDFTLLTPGVTCWAKYDEDDLWYEATVLAHKEDDKWLVLYTAYNETAVLPTEALFPQELGVQTDSEYDSYDEPTQLSRQQQQGASSSVHNADVGRSSDWHLSGAKRLLGDWEKYTSGFGSKMLAKMGYVPGHGLGKDLEGRVEPVEVEVLPQGCSLDTCLEMREKGQLDHMERKRKRMGQKTDKALDQEAEAEDNANNVFNLINCLTATAPEKGSQKTANSKSKSPGTAGGKSKTHDKKSLNVQIFQNQEDIRNAKKKLVGCQQSLKRNVGTSLEAQYEQKVREVQLEIQRLESREKSLQQQQQQNTTHKKLTVF